MRRNRSLTAVLLAICMSALVGGILGKSALATEDKVPEHYKAFTAALSAIEANYVDKVESDRLVYGAGPVQLGTYEYQRWAEPPTEMVQDGLIASLRSSGQFRSVSAISSNLRGEYLLRGHLNALDEVDKPEIAARFSIQLELMDSKTGASLWTGSYSHDTPVAGKAVADVVQALDQNVHDGLSQLSAQVGEYFASHPLQSSIAQ